MVTHTVLYIPAIVFVGALELAAAAPGLFMQFPVWMQHTVLVLLVIIFLSRTNYRKKKKEGLLSLSLAFNSVGVPRSVLQPKEKKQLCGTVHQYSTCTVRYTITSVCPAGAYYVLYSMVYALSYIK